MFLLDPKGNVTSWNAGAEHFSCFYPPEIVAKGWPDHELELAGYHPVSSVKVPE
jgi:hypothetical protein